MPPNPTFGLGGAPFGGPWWNVHAGQPVQTVLENRLGRHPLAAHVDTTVHGTVPSDRDRPRTTLHLHGGVIPASEDGHPLDTITPGGDHTYTWEQWERRKSEDGQDAANAEQEAALKAGRILVKDAIADITLQQVLTRANEFDVIATLNLNGDYLSDALAAQVGGIGIAPGGNINNVSGHAVFEATHGTAPKYANLDVVNPGSLILSGEMMLRYMGWTEAADRIISSMDKTIGQKTVTYDFARLMEGATKVKCSEFATAMIRNM